MENENKYKPPEAGPGDAGYAIVKAGISMLPIAGAPASELLELIVSPPLEKRRSEWMEKVGAGLRDLEQKLGVALEELPHNDKFIDAVMDATQIALRTSQTGKVEFLRNALLNTAITTSLDDSIQKMFFSFIDIFTVFHIKMLELFQSSTKWFAKQGLPFPNIISGPLSRILENAFPILKNKREFYDQVWKDLYLRGLVSIDGLHGIMSLQGIMTKRTTEMGDSFLNFISNPLLRNQN